MEKILVIADSPSDLNKKDIEGLPIWIAPVIITYDGKARREFFEIDCAEFWKELERLDEIPMTAQVTPPEWAELYKQAAGEGYTHIIVHTISTSASGNCNSAVMGSELFSQEYQSEEKLTIEVIDSRSYAFIYGRNVIKIAEMIRSGASFDDSVATLKDLTRRSRAALWVYTLKHMKKSGRISGMAAFVGETLGLRPVLYIKNGLIAPVDKVRGDKNVVPRAIQLVAEKAVDPQDQIMEILYSDVPQEEIDRTVQLLKEIVNPRGIVLHEIGCAVTINCGPTAMAICFYGKPY